MCARCPWLKRGRYVAEPKEVVASAIAKAQANLEEALAGLEKMPAFDAGSVAFAAHTLNNYLTVTGAVVELILLRLADHPDADLRTWLDSLQHANNLMARIVAQLRHSAGTTDAPLRLESFDLPTMVRRACSHYKRVAERKSGRSRLAAGSPIRCSAGVGGSRPCSRGAGQPAVQRGQVFAAEHKDRGAAAGGDGLGGVQRAGRRSGPEPGRSGQVISTGRPAHAKAHRGRAHYGLRPGSGQGVGREAGRNDLVPKRIGKGDLLLVSLACLPRADARRRPEVARPPPESGEAVRPNNDS